MCVCVSLLHVFRCSLFIGRISLAVFLHSLTAIMNDPLKLNSVSEETPLASLRLIKVEDIKEERDEEEECRSVSMEEEQDLKEEEEEYCHSISIEEEQDIKDTPRLESLAAPSWRPADRPSLASYPPHHQISEGLGIPSQPNVNVNFPTKFLWVVCLSMQQSDPTVAVGFPVCCVSATDGLHQSRPEVP